MPGKAQSSSAHLPSPPGRERSTSRAVQLANQLGVLSRASEPGTRLGTKESLRAQMDVPARTFQQALQLAQSRGVITVRPGPQGGLFSVPESPLVRLGNTILALHGDISINEAVRMRDALDPLLIEDAIRHASFADLDLMRQHLTDMQRAADQADARTFFAANRALCARLCGVSPHAVLRAVYQTLLQVIEQHSAEFAPAPGESLQQYLQVRYGLYADLILAISNKDGDRAAELLRRRNT